MPYSDLLKGRFSETNRIYHITWVTLKRKPLFLELDKARTIIKSLKSAHEQGWCFSYCFVVMPDHVHWLVQLRSKTLDELIHSIKSFTGNQSILKTESQIWQRGYFDQAIRSEAMLKPFARYIVSNPIRAGLVANIRDYPHWDAVWF